MIETVDAHATCFVREFAERGDGLSASENELEPQALEIAGKAFQRSMKPPALCRPHFPFTGPNIVQHVNGNNRPIFGGRDQRGLIANAQVLAKPQDDWIRDWKTPFRLDSLTYHGSAFEDGLSTRYWSEACEARTEDSCGLLRTKLDKNKYFGHQTHLKNSPGARFRGKI